MTKYCPECGKELPDEAHFCLECGYDFFQSNTSTVGNIKNMKNNDSIFTNGKIFLILIAIVVIVGAVILFSFGLNGDGNDTTTNNVEHVVDLTITDVSGWDSDSSNKHSYTLYTKAIFNKVPSDLKGYNIKTTYYDKNGSEIGNEIETLDNVYYDTNYAISFGYYTSYVLPNPDYVVVEIIKDGQVVDNFTAKIDQSGIDYLN